MCEVSGYTPSVEHFINGRHGAKVAAIKQIVSTVDRAE